MKNQIDIKIFVMPVGECSYEKSWQFAVDMLSKKIKERYKIAVNFKLIEMFSKESFLYNDIIEGIQKEQLQTPIIILNGRIIQSGGKLSERFFRSAIENEINDKGANNANI